MTFNSLIQILVLLLITDFARPMVRTSRTYYLLKDDVINLEVSKTLNYKYMVNDIKVTSNSMKLYEPHPFKEIEVVKKKMDFEPLGEKSIIASVTYKENVAYMYKKDDQIYLLIGKLKRVLTEYQVEFYTKLFVTNDRKCTKIQMDDQYVYAACISKIENNLQICQNKYGTDLITECKYYNVDYRFSDQELEEQVLDLEIYINNQNKKVIFLYFKNSSIKIFKNQFFMIIDGTEKLMTIEKENFTIDKIKAVSYNEELRYISCLVMKIENNKKELYHMTIHNNMVDNESIDNGFVKGKLRTFDYSDKVILTYEEDHENNKLLINNMSLNDLTHKEVTIDQQSSMTRASMGSDVAIIQTTSVNYIKEINIFNVNTTQLFKLNLNLKDADYWTLLVVDRVNFLVIFDLRNNNLRFYQLEMFPQFGLRYDSDLYDKKASADFRVLDQSPYKIKIQYFDFDAAFLPQQNNFKILPAVDNYVKIHYLKNNATFMDDNVLYFTNLEVTNSDDHLEKCEPLYWMYISNFTIFFCSNGTVLAFNDTVIDGNHLNLKSAFTFKLFPHIDPKDIVGTRQFYSSFIVILMKDMKVYAFDSKRAYPGAEMRLHETDLSGEGIESCKFSNQGFICQTPTTPKMYLFRHLSFKKGYITIQENMSRPVGGIVNDNISNSYFNRYMTYELVSDNYTDTEKKYYILFKLKGKAISQYTNFPIEINDKSRLYQISNFDILVYIPHPTSLQLFVLSEGNYLTFPVNNKLKGYKELITFVFNYNSSFFAAIYRTFDDKIRAVLFKNSTHYANRMIREFFVDDHCELTSTYLHITEKGDVLLLYLCKSPKHSWKAFHFNHNGPVIKVHPMFKNQTICVEGADPYNVFFNNVTISTTELSITAKDFIINDSNEKVKKINLEEEKYITLKGNVEEVKLNSNSPFIHMIKRANVVDEIKFEIDNNDDKGVAPYPNLKALVINDQFNLLYGSYLYRNERIEDNSNFKECWQLIATYVESIDTSTFSNYYLCRGEISQQLFVTDFKDFRYKIPDDIIESNATIRSPYLMKVKNFAFITLRIGEDKIFQVLKFIVEERKFKIISSQFINAKLLSTLSEFVEISNYFATYLPTTDDIALFFHPAFSNQLNIVFINAEDNFMNFFEQEIIEFYDGERLNFYSSKFLTKDENTVTVFITTFFQIYEIDLTFNDNSYDYKIKDFFVNPKGNSITYNMLAFSDDYFALLITQDKESQNILIYERDHDIKSNDIYVIIGQKDFKSDDYHIASIEMAKISGQNYLFVVYYENKKEGNRYGELKLKKIEIDSLKLEIVPRKLRYKETIELQVSDINHYVQKTTFEITIYQNYKIFMFMVIFIILILLFIALMVLIVFVYRENARLKQQLFEDLQERGSLSQNSGSHLVAQS